MVIVPLWLRGPRQRPTRVAHQPQHPALRSTHAGQAQPRPGLAVALAEEPRVGEHRADPLGQRRVRPGLLRPALRRRLHGTAGSRPSLVDRRAGNLPELADAGRAVAACCGGRAGPAHRLDLRRAKGSPASAVRARSSSSSLPIVIAPTLACSRRISSSRSSAGRLFSDAWPAARKRSRHCASVAAVTPSSRESIELLAVQQPQHRLGLAPRGEATSLPPRLATPVRSLR